MRGRHAGAKSHSAEERSFLVCSFVTFEFNDRRRMAIIERCGKAGTGLAAASQRVRCIHPLEMENIQMNHSSKHGNTVKAILWIVLPLASFAAALAHAEKNPVDHRELFLVVDNTLWNAEALMLEHEGSRDCYAAKYGVPTYFILPPPPLPLNNTDYLAIGMSSRDCAEGTGIPGVSLQFTMKANEPDNVADITIAADGIQVAYAHFIGN
ncbi:hypothetical protein ACFOPN_13750 [Xanthomonas hyacinthi]